ncbi:MAG: flagellin lysine-N-methylase [Magnetococcales bacterium]|nr:flagellin lysine-N-methylase [Magnetococcales bacterium]
MFIESITLNYLAGFSCIGSRCGDSCCTDWAIPLSADDHRRLCGFLETDPEGKTELRDKVVRIDGASDEGRFAIRSTPDARCPFLDDEHLCSLQRRFGEAVLPRLCSRFPRVLSIVGRRLELSATLACPETARRCLLDPQAMTVAPLRDGMIGNDIPHQFIIDLHHGDPYVAQFDRVRAELFLLCRLKEYPIATRLFLLGYFANRVEPFFHAKMTANTALLDQEIRRINRPEIQQEVHRRFEEIPRLEKKCLELLRHLLDAGFSQAGTVAFRSLLVQSLKGLGGKVEPQGIAAGIDEVLHRYHAAKAFWHQGFSRELDQYQTHFALNHIMSQPYLKEKSLLAYVRELLLFLAVLRFILFGLLAQTRETWPRDNKEQKNLLETEVVHTVQQFAKSIGHNPNLLGRMRVAVEDQGVTTLPHLVALITF